MDIYSLVGKTLTAVRVEPFKLEHPALRDLPKATTAFQAYLELSTGESIQINPCEVELPQELHPALGLECVAFSGRSEQAEFFAIGLSALPLSITKVDASDPQGEGTPTQFVFSLGQSHTLSVLHVSPMVLAVWATSSG